MLLNDIVCYAARCVCVVRGHEPFACRCPFGMRLPAKGIWPSESLSWLISFLGTYRHFWIVHLGMRDNNRSRASLTRLAVLLFVCFWSLDRVQLLFLARPDRPHITTAGVASSLVWLFRIFSHPASPGLLFRFQLVSPMVVYIYRFRPLLEGKVD